MFCGSGFYEWEARIHMLEAGSAVLFLCGNDNSSQVKSRQWQWAGGMLQLECVLGSHFYKRYGTQESRKKSTDFDKMSYTSDIALF